MSMGAYRLVLKFAYAERCHRVILRVISQRKKNFMQFKLLNFVLV